MKVLVCGSRDWTDYEAIQKRLSHLPYPVEIIEGGARGADKLARKAAAELGLEVVEHPANWKAYGKSAGFMRNIKMLDRENPALVIAFQKDGSRGTQHMIGAARSRGIGVEVIS